MGFGRLEHGARRLARPAGAAAVALAFLGTAAAPGAADAAAFLRTTVDDFKGISLAQCFQRSAAVYRAKGFTIAFAQSFGTYAQTDAGDGTFESSITCARGTGRTVIAISVAGPNRARTNAAALGLAEALVPGSTRAGR